jgi:hypothetical protein
MSGGGTTGSDTVQVALPWYLSDQPFKRLVTNGPDNAYILRFALKNEKTPTNNNPIPSTQSKPDASTNGNNTNNRNNSSNLPIASLMGFGPSLLAYLGNKSRP